MTFLRMFSSKKRLFQHFGFNTPHLIAKSDFWGRDLGTCECVDDPVGESVDNHKLFKHSSRSLGILDALCPKQIDQLIGVQRELGLKSIDNFRIGCRRAGTCESGLGSGMTGQSAACKLVGSRRIHQDSDVPS
mmetsp:Transcript_7053/g.12560  ORF Transcript_7053/g.12560 Transcript_7053/m.12560 type:complete len:133 (-) Transcript_7053:3970-4368(-)